MRCSVQRGERSKTVRSSRMSSSIVWDRRDALRVEECEISAAYFDRYKSIQERSKRFFITGIYRPPKKKATIFQLLYLQTNNRFSWCFCCCLSHNCCCFYDVFGLSGTNFVLICVNFVEENIKILSANWVKCGKVYLNCSGQATFSIWSINSSILKVGTSFI